MQHLPSCPFVGKPVNEHFALLHMTKMYCQHMRGNALQFYTHKHARAGSELTEMISFLAPDLITLRRCLLCSVHGARGTADGAAGRIDGVDRNRTHVAGF